MRVLFSIKLVRVLFYIKVNIHRSNYNNYSHFATKDKPIPPTTPLSKMTPFRHKRFHITFREREGGGEVGALERINESETNKLINI